MQKKTVKGVASFAILLLAFQSNAQVGPDSRQQQNTSNTFNLKEVVVSATRNEKNPLDVGRSISVISNEQIKNSGANTVAEVLSGQEGIFIVGTGQNPGQLQSIFTRGANSNHTVILIDGVKISDPSSTNNAIDLSELSLANIDRIEIVRGSHSTLYGSSAIGGVINIITKSRQVPGVHANAEIKTGTFGSKTFLSEANAGLNYTHESGIYVNAEALNTNVNGLNATVDTVTNPNNFKHNHLDRDGFNKTDIIGKIGYKNGNWDIFASYKNVNQKSDIDKGAFNDDDNYISKFRRNLTTYRAGYKINEKFRVAYNGGLTNLNHVYTDDSSVVNLAGKYDGTYSTGTYKASVFNHDIQGNITLKGFSAVLGGGVFNEKMTFDTYYYSNAYGVYESRSNLDALNINIKTVNEFAHVDLDGSMINEKWEIFRLGLGIRNTKHDLFGNNLTYEINPSLEINVNSLLFASISTGFNAPSPYQLYSPNVNSKSGITRGNKTLKPESSQSWEFGFKQQINDNLSYSLSYFKTEVKNSIDYVYLWSKNKSISTLGYADYLGDTYINIGKQTSQGVEIGINSKVSDKFWLNGNLSLISGSLKYSPSSIDNSHTQSNNVQLFGTGAFINKDVETIGLIRRPSTANIGFTYKPVERFSLNANIKYVGPRSDIYYNPASGPFGALDATGVADYTLVDVVMQYHITKHLSTILRAENIFDTTYNEIYGYTTRGRGFYSSFRYTL